MGACKMIRHQEDLILSFFTNDLNSDLGRSCDLLPENSALTFSRPSRDRAVETHCTVEGTATRYIQWTPL
jgi:hypothetical protein